MKDNVGGMESQMDLLLNTVTSVRSKSDGVNANLSARRERIESVTSVRRRPRIIAFVPMVGMMMETGVVTSGSRLM